MRMPLPNKAILKRRDTIIAGLRELVSEESLITEEEALRVYECDGLTAYRQLPLAVVLPKTVYQVSLILRYCRSFGVKVVPRGAGTSLSGGALPVADGVVLAMTKFNRILDIDYANRCITTQPGVTNLALSQAVEAEVVLLCSLIPPAKLSAASVVMWLKIPAASIV